MPPGAAGFFGAIGEILFKERPLAAPNHLLRVIKENRGADLKLIAFAFNGGGIIDNINAVSFFFHRQN